MTRLATLFAALLLSMQPVAVPASAHDYKLGALSIGHIWAPPPAPGADGIPVYGPLLNRGDHAVTLEGARSPAAKTVRLRIVRDGATSWPDHVTLSPGKPLGLAAWRVHLWLQGLTRDVAAGDAIPLTLDFGEAGTLDIEAVVEAEAGH